MSHEKINFHLFLGLKKGEDVRSEEDLQGLSVHEERLTWPWQ